MDLIFDIKQADAQSPRLGEAAALHATCLPETLTSQRGVKTIEGLYRHLLQQGHTAHFATDDNGLIGGLIVMRHACRQSNMFMTMYRPWTWIRAFRFLGVRKVFVQILDLTELRRATRQLAPHDYIVALCIDNSSRRIGVASNMLQHAISSTKVRGVGLAVDATLSNNSARNLYMSLGFVESHRTKLSVQFTLGLE